MLKINDIEYKVLSSEIKYVDVVYDGIKTCSLLVFIDIELNNIKGYISFYIDFFNTKDFKNIKNKRYLELPTNLESKISVLKIFDTKNFIDFIDSEVRLEFGDINNNQITMKLDINDKLIKLEYSGILNININN